MPDWARDPVVTQINTQIGSLINFDVRLKLWQRCQRVYIISQMKLYLCFIVEVEAPDNIEKHPCQPSYQSLPWTRVTSPKAVPLKRLLHVLSQFQFSFPVHY